MQNLKPFHIILRIITVVVVCSVSLLRTQTPVEGQEKKRELGAGFVGEQAKNTGSRKKTKHSAVVKKEEDKPLVFLLHGAKAKYEAWYKPGGDFHEILSSVAKQEDYGEVIPFSWSGKSGPPEGRLGSARIHVQAAQDLLKEVIKRTNGRSRRVILIGHSYGGVICMLLSHMLYNPARSRKKPQDAFRKLSASEEKMRILQECRDEVSAAIKEEQARWKVDEPPFIVEQLFTIATPIETEIYTANFDVVKKMFVLSSAGDGIQKFFGKRHYPRGMGGLNIRVAMESMSGGIFYPWHTKMRNELIARDLLLLPGLIEKTLGTKLTQSKGVDVLLRERGGPPFIKKIEHFKKRSFVPAGF